jgi:chaperonin GroES
LEDIYLMSATQTALQIRPLADRVVLEVVDETEMTAGGIYLPDTAREKPQQAVVRAAGPGATIDGKLNAMTVKVNDRVLFAKYAGTPVKMNGKEYIIVKENDILGIVEG